jgi:WD40 repeat protein
MEPICAVTFSPNGDRIISATTTVTGFSFPRITIWDATTGREMSSFTSGMPNMYSTIYAALTDLSVSHDRKLLAVSFSFGSVGSVKLLDAFTGEDVLSIFAHSFGTSCVAYSPDGTRIATGGDDRTVKVWDTKTGEPLLSLTEHNGTVNSVAFTADGTHVVSGGEDGRVILWDVTLDGE